MNIKTIVNFSVTSSLIRLTAFFLGPILMLSGTFSYAEPLTLGVSSRIISLPSVLGEVNESFAGPAGKQVIYIQDAHDSFEAQEKIAKIIDYLVEHYQAETVYEEGYEGVVPTDDYFAFIRGPKIRKKVSHFLMDSLLIGGAEYAHINRKKEFRLVGADSSQLHLENVEEYRRASAEQREVEKDILEMERRILKLAQSYFPPKVKSWMKLKQRFDQNAMELSDYIPRLISLLPPDSFSRERFPAIFLFLDARQAEERGENLQDKIHTFDFLGVFREIAAAENLLARTFLKERKEQKIFHMYKTLQTLKRLNRLEMSGDEYSVIQKNLLRFSTRRFADFLSQETGRPVVLSKYWEERISHAKSFYKLAMARDRSVEERLRTTDSPVSILVFGGFHKEKIKQSLRRLGYSYAVLTPRITQTSKKHEAIYRKLMRRRYSSVFRPDQSRSAAAQMKIFRTVPGTEFPRFLARYLSRFKPALAEELKSQLKKYPAMSSELRAAPSAELPLDLAAHFEKAVKEFPDEAGGRLLSDDDRAILERIAGNNRWAVEEGLLDLKDVFRAYFEGPRAAERKLREKIESGVKTWSELLFILEMYPDSFERVYVDLDDTLFAPSGYVGSEAWLREQMETYGKRILPLRAAKLAEEKRLLGKSAFSVMELDLSRRLMRLKEKGIQIHALTARSHDTADVTEGILRELQIDIPVHYAGQYKNKSALLREELGQRKAELAVINEERMKAARQKLGEKASGMSDEEFEELVAENAELESQKLWVFIDDRMDRVLRPGRRRKMLEEGLLAFPYLRERRHKLEESLELYETAVHEKDDGKAENALIDALSLFRLSGNEDAVKRGDFYLRLFPYIQSRSNDRLIMAYVESITDFLARGLDKQMANSENLLNIYFALSAPHNPEAFVRAYQNGKVPVRMISSSRGGRHLETNYEITINPENIYLFLEPLLSYIRQNAKDLDVLILPDTGARPFLPLIQKFLAEEGISIPIVIFPISRNTASDTVYEIRRWLKLVAGEIEPHEAEREFVRALSEMNFAALKDARRIAVLDDNITSGETVQILIDVLRQEGQLESAAALTPFAFRSPELYSFPVLSTFRLFGNYAWSGGGAEVVPPVAVVTEWENDSAKRGLKSRKRFQLPPAAPVKPEAAAAYQALLLAEFGKTYDEDQSAAKGRAPPVFAAKLSTQILEPVNPLTVSAASEILPDQIPLENGVSLVRRRGTIPDSEWAYAQNTLSKEDRENLSKDDVLVYEIVNLSGQVLGFAAFALVADDEGRKGLVIRKIQPKMQAERSFDPVQVIEAVKKETMNRADESGILSLYLDSYEVTMTGLSQSHWARRTVRDKYRYLPRVSEDLYFGEEISAWIDGVNLLWRKTTEEQDEKFKKSKNFFNSVRSKSAKRLFNALTVKKSLRDPFSRKRFTHKIRSALEAGLPLERADDYFLQAFAGFIKRHADLDSSTLNVEQLETFRTQILYQALLYEFADSEEMPAFPENYFSGGPEGGKIRMRAALDYFFNHVWTGGANISSFTRQDLANAGLSALFGKFDYLKGKLLEFIAPGAYVFQSGRYVPNKAQSVTLDMFQNYLNGRWYAIAPGMSYKISGDEKSPQWGGPITQLLGQSAGRDVFFADDSNHGLIATVKEEDEIIDYLYHDRGRIRTLRSQKTDHRDLGFLDIKFWALGREIHPGDRSLIAGKVSHNGTFRLEEGIDLGVSNKHSGAEVVGVLEEDLNHGVVVNWFLNTGTREAPGKGQYINSLIWHKRIIQRLNQKQATDRNLVWRDILLLREGKLFRSRPGSYVTTANRSGVISIQKRFTMSVWKTEDDKEREVMGVFREDLNFGVVLEWFLNVGSREQPVQGALLSGYYWEDGRIRSLNEGGRRTRTFTDLDFIAWRKGKKIKPRPFPGNRIVRRVNGKVVRLGEGLFAGIGKRPGYIVGILREDLNHGTVAEWFENTGAVEAPVSGKYITGHYWEKGEFLNLNLGQSKGRTFHSLDFSRWKKGADIIPRLHGQSYLTGKTKPNGKFNLGGGETFSLGDSFKNMEVFGILSSDLNYSTVITWYKNEGTRENPVKGGFLTGHYRMNGEVFNLNYSGTQGRTFGWLDMDQWAEGKKIQVRADGQNYILFGTIRKGYFQARLGGSPWRAYVGRGHNEKAVMGMLNLRKGVVVMDIYENTGTEQEPIKGDLISSYTWQAKKDNRSELREISLALKMRRILTQSWNISAGMFFPYQETVSAEPAFRDVLVALAERTRGSAMKLIIYGVTDPTDERLEIFRKAGIKTSPLPLQKVYEIYGAGSNGRNVNVSTDSERLKRDFSLLPAQLLKHVYVRKDQPHEIWAAYRRAIADHDQPVPGMDNSEGYYEVAGDFLRSELREYQASLVVSTSA